VKDDELPLVGPGPAESEEPGPESYGWLDHPEVQEAFDIVLTDLLEESDRGATLIAADIISNHLDEMFERLAPSFLKAKVTQMISYPGVASTLSGKADIAALNGWLDETAYKAIGHLRRLRNEAAHSNKNFSLRDQNDRLAEMLNLGDNVPAGLHAIAGEILVLNFFQRLQASGEKLKERLGKNPFATVEQILEELERRPDWSDPIEERLPRLKLGLAVCLILSLMLVKREKLEGSKP